MSQALIWTIYCTLLANQKRVKEFKYMYKNDIYCCAVSVASEQQHNQDLRRIYKREYKFWNSSLFTRVHCTTFHRVHCVTNYTKMSRHLLVWILVRKVSWWLCLALICLEKDMKEIVRDFHNSCVSY